MFRRRTKLKRVLWNPQQRQKNNIAPVEKCYSTSWEQARPYNDIPKVGTLHFFYNLLPGGKYYKTDLPGILLNLRKTYGNIYRLPGNGMNNPKFVVTNEPDDFERVFRAEGVWPERPGSVLLRHYRSEVRKDFFQGVEGVLATQGEKWGRFRSSVNPVLMQPKAVRHYYQKMSQVNKEFIKRIREIRDNSTYEVPANFEQYISRWTLESVCIVALDKQLGLIGGNEPNPQAEKLFDALTQFSQVAADIELKPAIWRYVATSTYKKSIQVLDDIQSITNSYVDEASESIEREPINKPEHEQSVLEKLLKIDKHSAKVMAMELVLAGVDTTTSAFTGILLCLAKNPEKQSKLREEVLRLLPQKDSEFTLDSLKNMHYLRACIKEGLRLYPLSPGNARVIKSDIVMSGYRVPKETSVMMLTKGLLNDNQYYPRAMEFQPERWLRQTAELPSTACPHGLKPSSPFIFLPFGFGSRMCIGKRIVDVELELGLARLIRNFYVEFNYSTENAFRTLLIMVPNIPLKFKFTDVER